MKGNAGGATMDFMDLERERGITIQSACTRVEWDGHPINVIDTPGHVDFTVEVERSLRVLDGAILVLCAVGGVQSQSLTVDRQMKRYGIPRIAFINKMDRTGADPDNVIKQIGTKLGVTAVPLQYPIGKEMEYKGAIDLVEMQAVFFEGEQGEEAVRKEIPAELQDAAEIARANMLEQLSLFDDDLMVALLEEEEPTPDQLYQIIRRATLSQEITPVLMGTAYRNRGVQELLDAVVRYLPSPPEREVLAQNLNDLDENGKGSPINLVPDDKKPVVTMAFKTVLEAFGQLTFCRVYQGTIKKGDSYTNARTGKKVRFSRLLRMHADDREEIDTAGPGDIIAVVGVDCASGDTFCGDGMNVALENIFVPEAVIRLSVEPLTREGADRLGKALERFRREDPTFRVTSDPETNQTIIAGMGQLHLEVYIERMKREYNVEAVVGEPKVAYRECPTKEVEFNFKHKKQTGGSGQYAHIVGRLVPLPEGSEESYVFSNKVTQGRIPKEYIPAVDQGMRRSIDKGPLCECEVVGVEFVLEDGSYHDVDSSEMAFKTAGFNCARETLKKCGMILLEPIMSLEIEAPEEYQGSICGHLSSKRGLINSTDAKNNTTVILGEVPLSEMFDYANELRSMTQGKGQFSMEFLKYSPTPRNIQEDVVEKRRKEKEERLAMA
ncbi:MAG: elongation factor G [Planctomycetota bacterium]|nr:elongation factor G [Planctomycetota bacterium]